MSDPLSFVAVLGIFVLAGLVKGVVGLGLPTISLALLSMLFDLPTAMALLVVPSLVTNLWQGFYGNAAFAIVRRLWPFLLSATLSVGIGTRILSQSDPTLLTILLGIVLMLYAGIELSGRRASITVSNEGWSGVLSGLLNGVLGGMTGSFLVPGVLYLQATGMRRDELIKAMGVLFTLSSLALTAALAQFNLLSVALVSTSAIAVIPALAGLWVGERLIRHRLPERYFRVLFFSSLLSLGAILVAQSLVSLR